MTDAEYAAEQARILRLIDYWRPRLHQSSWRLNIEWSREEKTSPAHEEGWTNVIRFEVRADWKYAKARIYAYCGSTAPLSDEEIEESVVHELCHCLVHELQDVDGISNEYHAHEEHVVTILARAFIETRNRALDGDTDSHQVGAVRRCSMGMTSRARKLTKQSATKERQQARAIFANAHGNKKAVALAKTLQRSATRKRK